MIKHLLKQIWVMRSKNIWVILELFLVFIVFWYVVDFFSVMGINTATPVGADIKNVYRVIYSVYMPDNPQYTPYENRHLGSGLYARSEEPGKNFLRMVERLREHPEIESVCTGTEGYYPYGFLRTGMSIYNSDSLLIDVKSFNVSPEYFKMFNVLPSGGTDPEVLTQAILEKNSIILSEKTKEAIFKDASTVGQMARGQGSAIYGFKVSGVTRHIKQHEYTRPGFYIISLFDENNVIVMDENNIPNYIDICIKTRPGVSSTDFPERFKNEMRNQLAIGNYFLVDIIPLTKQREMYLKASGITTTLNYRIGISIFFLINIFLGVLGTFWLRIEKRKPEIGIRMSMGSTKVLIMKQMFTESMCLLGIASVPAILVCVNMAFMDIMPTENMDFTVVRFLLNTFITYILFIVVISLSTLYPARRLANIKPAEALHYE